MALSDKVRYFRKQKGWSQRELAEAAGVYHPRVAEIETGRSESRKMAARLLKAMGYRLQTYILPIGQEFELRRRVDTTQDESS